MFKLLFLSIIAALMCSCATTSAPTKSEYLVGTPDEAIKSKKIGKALTRSINIKKKFVAGSKYTGKTFTGKDGKAYGLMRTGTNVSVKPYTEPYVIASTKESIKKKAFKENWSEEKTQQEQKNAIERRLKKLTQDQQCFDMVIKTKNDSPVLNMNVSGGYQTPEELKLKYWYVSVEQNGTQQKMKLEQNAQCLIKTISSYGVASSMEYECFTTACSENTVNMTESFSVTVDARYNPKLHPVSMKWEGVKKSVSSKK